MSISGEYYLQGEGLGGWAKDSESASPLWLEILYDDESLGVVQASLREPDNCGFWFPLPPAVLQDGGAISVRVANGPLLPQAPLIIRENESGHGLAGDLIVDRGLCVSGWALDPRMPEKKLRILAFVDEKPAAETTAHKARYRPEQANGHAFSLDLPVEFADGKKHEVWVMDEKKRHVPGSPFHIRTIPLHLADWLESRKNIGAPERSLLAELLTNMEFRSPGLLAQTSLPVWEKAFPLPKPQKKTVLRLASFNGGRQSQRELKNQQFVEAKKCGQDWNILLAAREEDELHPWFLAHLGETMGKTKAALVYADGVTKTGETLFRSAWDRFAFLGADYLGPFLVSRQAFEAAGLTPADDYWSARFKLALAAEKLGGIIHLPLNLATEEKPQNSQARMDALNNYLAAHATGSRATPMGDFAAIQFSPPRKPKISIIIPTRDKAHLLRRCVQSLETTNWPDLEILIMDNDSREEDALSLLGEYAARENIRVIAHPGLFNYADMNNRAAQMANGELLCLLNNDTESTHADWLLEMAAPLLASGGEIGAVGAKLLWPNNLVQHGGVVVGIHQLAGHVGNLWLADEPGYMLNNQILRQYSCVTAACLLTPRSLYLEAGGLDGRAFPVAFNDVDYCLRLREMGKKILWTPRALLLHHESASRGRDETPGSRARAEREMQLFRTKWGAYQDPFYNPNLPLSVASEPFMGLAFPPRGRDAR